MASAIPRDLPPTGAGLSGPAARGIPAAWRESAGCRQADPELFFPIGLGGAGAAEARQAKAFCASCPVRQPCLEYALMTRQEFGIWGGCDENERHALHRQWRETRIARGEERIQG